MSSVRSPGGNRRRSGRIARVAAPVFAVLLFVVAVGLLHAILRHYHLRDVVDSLRAIPGPHLAFALLGTLLSYLVLTGYDALALRYTRRTLPYRKIAFASFVSYAFANNTGSLAIIASGGIRYRLYGAWGLSAVEIGKIIAFSMLTFWLGVLALGGSIFLAIPIRLPPGIALSHLPLSLLGGALLAVVGAYVVLCLVRRKPLIFRTLEIELPSPLLAVAQLGFAVTDLTVTAGILFVLLPAAPSLSFHLFLGMFITALLIGLLSNVPGGLGVFEAVMLLFLAPFLSQGQVIGSLLVFRAIYYLVPFMIAATGLAGYETLRKRERLGRAATLARRWVSGLVPPVLSLAVFVGGAVLLFSGALPGMRDRLLWLETILPLPIMELSHFLGSLAGMGLLVLAGGLRKRLDGAYFLSVLLLAAGIVFSLLKGFDYEEALWLALILAILVPCRREFYRKTPLLASALSADWIGAMAIVVLASVWLGLFAYKHVEYSGELWWQFTLAGDAPRFLRASVGVIVGTLLLAVLRLLRPARLPLALPGPEELERAAAIANGCRTTTAYLALLGDKTLLFNDRRNAFVMCRVEGQSWVALGDPVGPAAEQAELLWRFMELCDRQGGRPAFYEVGRENLHLYLDLGLTPMKIGEEGRVALADFSLEGSARKGLRQARNLAIRQGCSFEVVAPAEVAAMLPLLREVSDAWLSHKNTQEKGFSLGFFKEAYLEKFPAALVRRAGEVIAFATVWPGGDGYELSVDLMRFRPDAPNGIMDYLFVETMLWGKAAGYQWFVLGMAPLAGLEDRALAPLWNKIGAFVFHHGEHFYNFQGLRRYKNKFEPIWEPKYLVTEGGLALPRRIVDITSLIAGGAKGIFMK